ncbi:MAG: ATP-grasp domain-containing protein [Methanomicrobiales archaeon]|nr:ATP-grasp domain-containing protein [Methanomicrobiales archaeon]
MKVLLAEYTVFCDPHLAPEGEAMLRTLSRSFARCGHDVVSPESGNFEAEIRRLAPVCDMGLVIAPDHLLAGYTRIIEQATHNLGCGSMNAALCANKQRTAAVLTQHGIAVPGERTEGRKVIKEIRGCGTHNMRLSEEEPGPGEFGQDYIEGESLSVSLVGSRIVGEACLYYSGRGMLPLALNRQRVTLRDGFFRYEGGETPVDHPRKEEIIATAAQAATVLGCQGYVGVDVVVADRIYVVDVNPRITTSITGIAAVMQEEVAGIIVAASRGETPESVHLTGRARYDTGGRVERL